MGRDDAVISIKSNLQASLTVQVEKINLVKKKKENGELISYNKKSCVNNGLNPNCNFKDQCLVLKSETAASANIWDK